ncbi:MAG: glutamine amidotransferase [Solirubrobacterales bacterium]
MARILIAGESWITQSVHQKGFDSFTTIEYHEGVVPLRDALVGRGHVVDYQPCHVAAVEFPFEAEGLDRYQVVILSDIGSNTLLLPPAVFAEGRPRPNRLGLLRDWVHGGGGLIMAGGYLSFQGIEGKANYRATPLADVLPVTLDHGDDRRELPEGRPPQVELGDHPTVAGVGGEWPAMLGYQHVTPRADTDVVVTIDGDPLVAVGSFGSGAALAFTSDVGPHWAPREFVEWPGYAEFWDRAVRFLAGEAPAPHAIGGKVADVG